MVKLPQEFYDGINTLIEKNCQSIDPLDPTYKKILGILRNCFIVGSTVINDKITWQEDNDIDIFFYKHHAKNSEKNQVIKLFNFIEEGMNFDILPFFATDNYHNIKEPKKSLTECIFSEKRKLFTNRVGMMSILNYEGFFLSKIATLCVRDEEKDYFALKILYKEFKEQLPYNTDKAIKEYGLQDCMNGFLERYNKDKN